ncbi:MAG: YhdH/YhfP family quinone oxidoreductase [Balneolaceae bacterium]
MKTSKPEITYRALVARKEKSGGTSLSVENLNTRDLPDRDVLVRVHYSSLNYKDALSASGNPGVTKNYPHTPGIDAAGIVEHSRDNRFKKGDEVIITSYDLGQNTPGGFGEYIAVPGDWIVPLPKGLTLKESMILGTAGFTAGYGVRKIVDQKIKSEDGKIVVTGATGGVGSIAVALLSNLGFTVIAVTGKKTEHDFLKELGAEEVVNRENITNVKEHPLLGSRWIAAIDTVGGSMLDAILRQTSHNGVVACCGNVLGGKLKTSIYPFILRGIGLMGIDSGICLMKDRIDIWNRLAGSWKLKDPQKLYREVSLDKLSVEIEKILKGNQVGRVLVTLRD